MLQPDNRFASAMYTFLPHAEPEIGKTDNFVYYPQGTSRPGRLTSVWYSSSFQPSAAGKATLDSNGVATHTRRKNGTQFPVFFAGEINGYGVAQSALGTSVPSYGSQTPGLGFPRLPSNAIVGNGLRVSAGGCNAASPDEPSFSLGIGIDREQCAQDLPHRQCVSSTYKLFDFTPQDKQAEQEDSSTGRSKIPMCLSSSGLSGSGRLVEGATAGEPGALVYPLVPVAMMTPGYFPPGFNEKNREDAPVGTVDLEPVGRASNAVGNSIASRGVRQPDQLGVFARPQKKGPWQSGEPDSRSASKGKDITMTGDIRFVQAAESLSERYGMPFMCVFVPQQGYNIQFLEGGGTSRGSASGLNSACPDSKSLNKAISELTKSVLDSNQYIMSHSTTAAPERLPLTSTVVEKLPNSAFTALPMNQTPSAPPTASLTDDKHPPLDHTGAVGVTSSVSPGMCWIEANAERRGKEAAGHTVDAAAPGTDSKSALLESNGAATASLLSVLSNLPELDLVETESRELGRCRLQGYHRSGLSDQPPASPLNLTTWLERQQSNGREKHFSDLPVERPFTLLSAPAGDKSAVTLPQSNYLLELTPTKRMQGSASAVTSAMSATCGIQALNTFTNQGGLEVSERDHQIRLHVPQKAVGHQLSHLQKSEVEVSHVLQQPLSLPLGPTAFSGFVAPLHERESQQQILWNVWQTLPQNGRASSAAKQHARDNSESNNTSTAYGSFWSRTVSGSIPSCRHGSAGSSEINLPEKDNSNKTTLKTTRRPRTPLGGVSRDLRYTTSVSQARESSHATVLSLANGGVTNARQKSSAASICASGQRQQAGLKSRSVSRCEGLSACRLLLSGSSCGDQWRRSATADVLSSV